MTTIVTTPLRAAATALLAALLCSAALGQTTDSCPPVAQAPSTEQLQAGARNAQDHGFLWRISKNGHSSWLYGTLHVAKFDWAFPGPKMNAALEASDTVALEMDMLDPDIRRRLAQGMAAQARTPLPDALQQRLERAEKAECVPVQALAGYAPEMQIATLTTLIGRRDGLDPGYGLDIFLAGWGHGAKRSVVSLESPELQLKALQPGNAAETISFVDDALGEIESGNARRTLQRVAQVWSQGNWSALTGYAAWCDCLKTAADRAEMKRMLDDRNPGLADGIDALHASGKRVFAAVGSLHMIGPTGLPALMAGRGYRVEQIDYKNSEETTP